MRKRAALGIALMIVSSCGKSEAEKDEARQGAVDGSAEKPTAVDGAIASITPNREFDEDAAEDAARDSLSGEAYEAIIGAGDCAAGCEGHEAGWRWADEGNDCSGSSQSFVEGCEAFSAEVDRRVENARELFNSGDDTFVKD